MIDRHTVSAEFPCAIAILNEADQIEVLQRILRADHQLVFLSADPIGIVRPERTPVSSEIAGVDQPVTRVLYGVPNVFKSPLRIGVRLRYLCSDACIPQRLGGFDCAMGGVYARLQIIVGPQEIRDHVRSAATSLVPKLSTRLPRSVALPSGLVG